MKKIVKAKYIKDPLGSDAIFSIQLIDDDGDTYYIPQEGYEYENLMERVKNKEITIEEAD
tara:strand:- start:455 stop:634 length:180 start_codon:yes stop_codon:yes gene_type:complete